MEKRLKSFDGTKIFYSYYKGKNPFCLVFLHGVGANWTVWKKEIDFFQRKGFSTLAIDLRGHGQSDAPSNLQKYQLTNFSKDVHKILCAEKIKKFVLIGHSLGGGVSLSYSMLFPKKLPLALILIETSCLYPFNKSKVLNFGPYAHHFISFLCHHKSNHKTQVHFEETDLSDFPHKIDRNILSYIIHLTPLQTLVKALENAEYYAFKNKKKIHLSLEKINVPLLVIAGDHDPIVPARYSLAIKKLIHSAELRIVKDNHHLVIMEKPEETNKLILTFLIKNFPNLFCI